MAEKVPGWIERLLLPQLSEIKGDIKALAAKVNALDTKIDVKVDAVESKINSEFKTVNARLDSVITEIKDLRDSINMAQRLTILEAEVKELRKKAG